MAERVDWVEILDPRSGELMFANIRTGECLWEPPSSAKVKKSNTNQWWELYDETTRRYYYYNAHTKQTEWRKPKESDIITLAKLQNLKGKGAKRRSSSSKKEGSHRRRGSSSAQKDSGDLGQSNRDGERGSLQRKYSRHNSKESLSQLRKHRSSSHSGQSRQSKRHSSRDEDMTMSHGERRESEASSRLGSDSARSSTELKDVSSETTEEQIGERRISDMDTTLESLQGTDFDDLDHFGERQTTDSDTGACSQEMESTARNIQYLKISGEIPDDFELIFDTSFCGQGNTISPTDDLSERTSNCSMNQSNYVSDGPLSESEASALNDSFYSCDSKFAESNSDEKLELPTTESKSPNLEHTDLLNINEIPRTRSFFNKMVDREGNLRPPEGSESIVRERHVSDSGCITGHTSGLVLRGDRRSGRRRSSSLDNKSYNVSNSIYDNLTRTSDSSTSDEDDISLSEKLKSGGMPSETAALVEACEPSELDSPSSETNEESPSRSLVPKHQLSESIMITIKPPEEDTGIVDSRPQRPPPPQLGELRVTRPIVRSNTCPVQHRTPVTPQMPLILNKYTELDLSDQRRGFFGKKDNFSGMLAHSKAPIKKPVINTRDKKLKKEAVELFKLVLVYMGDRSARNRPPNVILWEIVTRAWANQPLRDELYFQLIKQTTDNSSSPSLKLGWELMAVCLAMFPPSAKYCSYLEGYVYSHLKDNQPANPILEQEISNRIAQYAENCHYKLEKMSKTGSRKGQRQPTQEEVDAAKRAIFHPSMFGSTLEDTMQMQKTRFPDRQLPWILTCLTERILNHNGAYTEGIFRVPGDIDEVNALKVKTDNWTYPDDVNDANVAASLLKQWFRDLREPVIDQSAYEQCISSCDDETVSKGIVLSLPKINQFVLCFIIRFLQIFCNRQVINATKMDVNNLAMVWAPNFLRCPSDDPQVIFENTRKEMTFVRTLLSTFDTSFMEGVK